METGEFRKNAHQLVDWMADYLENVHTRKVKPDLVPGMIKKQLPDSPPETPEDFQLLFKDFEELIVPGMTHWQHPNFHGYFPANNSMPSILAEMLTATMGAQCMLWLTSPAATELEEVVMDWLRKMTGLPESFTGVIQDTASTATLCALLTAREKKTNFAVNHEGFYLQHKFRIYCSEQAHSSIDKDVKIAGFGLENLVKIPVDQSYAMIPEQLEMAVEQDLMNDMVPLAVISTFGTTGSTAIDPVEAIDQVAKKHGLWHHLDAALGGNAWILPEIRELTGGYDLVDSLVFNPHKWLFTNFDCTAYFVKDPRSLVRTFSITPEYLKTDFDQQVNNYRDWGIQLGRRFRALKLWFVIRSFGVEGMQSRLRSHLKYTRWFLEKLEQHQDFEVLAPAPLNTICFRYNPPGFPATRLNLLNQRILERINREAEMFITHTVLQDRYSLRMVIGQTEVTMPDVEKAWNIVQKHCHESVQQN